MVDTTTEVAAFDGLVAIGAIVGIIALVGLAVVSFRRR